MSLKLLYSASGARQVEMYTSETLPAVLCQNESSLFPTIDTPPTPLDPLGEYRRFVRKQTQALDVDLQEPNMEVSAKQEGTKRFDDPGIAAALAGDTDTDGPGGGLLSVKSGKLEPKVL